MSLQELFHDVRSLLEPQVKQIALIFLIYLIPIAGPFLATGYMVVLAAKVVRGHAVEKLSDLPLGDAARWGIFSVLVQIGFMVLGALCMVLIAMLFWVFSPSGLLLGYVITVVFGYFSKWFIMRGAYMGRFSESFSLVNGFATIRQNQKRFWNTVLFSFLAGLAITAVGELIRYVISGSLFVSSLYQFSFTDFANPHMWQRYGTFGIIGLDTYAGLTGFVLSLAKSAAGILSDIVVVTSLCRFWDKSRDSDE